MWDRKWISGVQKARVKSVESISGSPTKLAQKLMDVFFTRDVMARSLVTSKKDSEQLDPHVIEGIRCEYSI